MSSDCHSPVLRVRDLDHFSDGEPRLEKGPDINERGVLTKSRMQRHLSDMVMILC